MAGWVRPSEPVRRGRRGRRLGPSPALEDKQGHRRVVVNADLHINLKSKTGQRGLFSEA